MEIVNSGRKVEAPCQGSEVEISAGTFVSSLKQKVAALKFSFPQRNTVKLLRQGRHAGGANGQLPR